MKLAEALGIVNAASERSDPPFRIGLACGFTPLHLQTFLAAHLQLAAPDRKIEVVTGLFGDVAGNVKRLVSNGVAALAVVIEWPDLDPRLGFRSLGGWGHRHERDLVEGACRRLQRLSEVLRETAAAIPITVAAPTIRKAPAFFSAAELATESDLRAWAAGLASHVRFVSMEALDQVSAPATRFDPRSDLSAGFPYSLSHADAVAALLARSLGRRNPKKAIITDLDDTLWRGIVGEIGPEMMTWTLDRGSQIHGLYQQMLEALALQGVLIGVASKNNSAVVERVWRERGDLLLSPAHVFPREVHWGPKSGSVSRILKTWNISADSAVFIDDTPAEIAEVQRVHPDLDCWQFPKNDAAAALDLLFRLRERFARDAVQPEDSLRRESLRQAQQFQSEASVQDQEEFLVSLEGEIIIIRNPPATETRILELVNKTNQFNLNGIRYSEAEWRAAVSRPDAWTMAVHYRDKFGPLGAIAVLMGVRRASTFEVETWVMSCRAFSRRIEYHCLEALFAETGCREALFRFIQTERNSPFHETAGAFLSEMRLTRDDWTERRPRFPHRVKVT